MMPGAGEDPVLRMLAELPPPTQRTDRADRVRRRCHEAFATRRRHERRRRSTATFAVDSACFLVLAVYLGGVVTEALRLSRFLW